MSEFEAGEVVVPVVPDASDFIKRLKKDLLGPITDIGRELGEDLAKGIRQGIGKGDPFGPLKDEQKRQQQQAPKDGDAVGGGFARGFKSRLEAAFQSLPKANLDADSSPADRVVADLRARLAALAGKTVGIDIDAGSALAELEALQRELSSIDRRTISVDARADIASALGELAAVRAEVDGLDDKTARVRVDVDTSAATSAIRTLGVEIAALSAIPIAASLAAGIGGLAAPLAAAGIGFAGLAATAGGSLGRINDALKAQKSASESASSGIRSVAAATTDLVIQQAQARIKTLQQAAAQDQLKASLDRVRTAQAAVSAARQRVADVEAQAAARVQQALDRVASAERNVASAQKEAQRAQEDLNKARKEAAQDLEDLANNVTDAELSLRGANFDLTDATAALKKAPNDPRAKLAYDEAVQRVKELQLQLERLKQQQTESAAKGVEGSDKVTAAKDREADAVQRVADAEHDVAQARAEAQAAQVDGDKQIAAAKAQIKAAEKQVEAAKQAVIAQKRQMEIAKLQDKIAKERDKLAARAAAQSASRPSSASADANKKFAALSPAGQAAAKQIKAFQDSYKKFQESLEPATLPVITGALGLVQRLFKPLTPLIKGVSGALVGLEKAAGKALGGKFWTSFFKDLADTAPTAIKGFGSAFGSVIKGVAGVVKAFLPFTGSVVGGIDKAAAAFARFGANLGSSKGFQSFIAYAKANGPVIIGIVKDIATVIGKLISGLAGEGSGALGFIKSITGFLAGRSVGQLQALATAALVVVAAFKGWKLITTAVDGVKKAVGTVKSIVSGAKTVWSGLGAAAKASVKVVKSAASGIVGAVKGIGSGAAKAGTAVWSGIRTAASKAASGAKTAASVIAGAAKSAGSAAAKGATAAWDGIRVAATKAGSAAKTAASAVVAAGKAAGTAAVNIGKVAIEYGKVAIQAALARTKELLFAAAQGIVRGATVLWTAAQRILNLVLNANPIGLIITALGLVAAAVVYLWNKFPPFRAAVEAAWQGIQTAVKWAWENVIQPALKAIWDFITNVLAPVFTWLWNNVIVPAWNGIAAAVKWAWNNVILPAAKAGYTFFKTVLAPVFTWLWNTIIKPAFNGIGVIIKAVWENVILPAVKAGYKFFKETLAPVFAWLWKTIIKPAWDGIGAAIKYVWDKVLKPTFDFLHDMIFKTIPDGFKKGVDFIKTAWDKVKDVAKKPVEFIVNTVYNNGIVKVWNAVADFLKLPKLSPVAFASGGVYPGYTPGKDVGLAAVSGGEAIMRPEWTRAVGEKYVHGANSAARSGGVGGVARFLGIAGDPGVGFAGAFAGGGIIGGIENFIAGGIRVGAEKLLNPLLDQATAAMGNAPWAKMLAAFPKKIVNGVLGFLGTREDAVVGPGKKAVNYARQQIGKPYQWGATGPNSFDCSGLVLRSLQAAGLTGVPRTSQAQAAWAKRVPTPRPGDLGFPTAEAAHVWLYSAVNKIIEAPYTGANVREVPARAAAMIGRAPQWFDQGGFLMPGTSLVHNGTGRPEAVFNERQLDTLTKGAQGGDGSLVTINGGFHSTPTQTPMGIARDLMWLSKSGG